MNILILSQYAGTPRLGMVFRNYAMAGAWVARGDRVTIVAGGYSHFRNAQPRFQGRIGEEIIDGIRFLWLWNPKYEATSRVGRLVSMGIYTLQCALPLPLESSYDIVIASSPHPFTIFPAARLARRYGARLIYDIRDLWPLTPMHLGNLRANHPFVRALQYAEDYACRHADLVTAVPHNCATYLAARGLPPERFLAIANGIVPDAYSSEPLPSAHHELLDALRRKGAFLLGYAGTLGTANGMKSVIEAMPLVPDHVHLVLLGDGSEKTHLGRLADDLRCAHRVHFLSPVSRNQVADFLRNVDAGYVGGRKSKLYEYGASITKLNDYMLAEIPILYSLGDPNNAVEVSGAGISCPPEDPHALANALASLVEMSPDQRVAMGRKGRAWCLKHRDVAKQVELIMNTLESLPRRL